MNRPKIKRVLNYLGFLMLSLASITFIQAQNVSPTIEKTSVLENLDKNAGENSFSSNDNGSPEEKLIRWAYKKLSVYETVGKFSDAEKKKQPTGEALAKKTLRFKLKDFQIGPIKEIQNSVYKDLVTLPTGQIIQVMPQTHKYKEEQRFYIQAKWRNGEYASSFDPQWMVGDILQLDATEFYDVEKYTSFEVEVSLEGKTRKYRALVLFGSPDQATGMPNPKFLDSIVGIGGTVTRVFKETKLPLGTKISDSSQRSMSNLKESEIKKSGLSKKDIKPYNLISPSCEVNWYPGCGVGGCLEWYFSPIGGSSSCLTYAIGYGPGGGDGGSEPEEEACKPLYEASVMPQKIGEDDQKHINGKHWGSVIFTTHCERTRECRQRCEVTPETGIGEEGEASNYFAYHRGIIEGQGHSADVPRGQNAACKGIAGVAFKECIVPNCSINLSLTIGAGGSGVTINVENEFWKHPFEHNGICNQK